MSNSTTDTATTIRRLIMECLPGAEGENPAIFGPGAPLDSLGLVNFLADLEYRLATELGRNVVLASDQTMSRARSPFRDVSALTEYIIEQISA